MDDATRMEFLKSIQDHGCDRLHILLDQRIYCILEIIVEIIFAVFHNDRNVVLFDFVIMNPNDILVMNHLQRFDFSDEVHSILRRGYDLLHRKYLIWKC